MSPLRLWRDRRGVALLAALLLLPGCFVTIDGEMGNASFRMDGGEDSSVQGAWGTDRAVALASVMSIRALPNRDMEDPLLESSNEEVAALRETLDSAPEVVASFEAVGTGRAAIELRRESDNRLIDFFQLDVEEAFIASLIRIRDVSLGVDEELIAPQFAVVEGMPVSIRIRLDDENGVRLNHHDVVAASSSATEVLEAEAGGEVVLLDANTVGTATLLLIAPDQPVSNEFEVSVLSPADVQGLELRQVEPAVCRDDKLLLVADLTNSEGLDVLGVDLDWELLGDELSSVPGDTTISVEFEADSFTPFTVIARYEDLEASFRLEEPILCTDERAGCSLVGSSASAGPLYFALLLLTLYSWADRRRLTVEVDPRRTSDTAAG
jgi:hypothetical protein